MAVMDFGDVAARIAAGVSGVRACLVVSRDGLSLGAHPAEGQDRAREVWDRLEQVGDLTRGFVEMGLELWVFGRRGPYAAVVVASPDVKPGLVLDRIEANLAAAEQVRSLQATEDPVSQPRPEPVRRPRSPLHPEPRLEPAGEPPRAEEPLAPEPAEVGAEEAQRSAVETVVDLSKLPDPEPADPKTDPDTESAPSPEPEPAPAARAPKPADQRSKKPTRATRKAAKARKAAEAPEPATPKEPPERVPTFTPASTPPPAETGDVYVAGVQPAPPEEKATQAPPEPQMPVEEPALPRRSGEVDRVALAREFGRLLRDEFGG